MIAADPSGGVTQVHNALNAETDRAIAQKSASSRCVDRIDVAAAEKFHDLRKLSSIRILKYFGLASLLCLRRQTPGVPGKSRSRKVNSMHIAQIAPLTEAIPPKLYGGTERVVSWLTEELIACTPESGHEAGQPARPSRPVGDNHAACN
jgi:hypothetical protein